MFEKFVYFNNENYKKIFANDKHANIWKVNLWSLETLKKNYTLYLHDVLDETCGITLCSKNNMWNNE